MGKKSGPSAPDPYKTAEAQYNFGKRAREDSLTNAVSAAGSSRYVKGPDGRFTLQTELSPDLKARYQDLASSIGGFDRGAMEKTLYDRSLSLMRPDLEQGRESLETRLNTQGIPIGTEAYQKEIDRFDRQENDLFSRMAMDAVINAGNESRADRGMDLNEMGSLLSMAPRAEGNTTMQAPDIASMIYQNYAQNSANHNNQKAGLGQLASSAAMMASFSDKALKTNIQKVGERFGFNWYRWTWNKAAEALGLGGSAEGVIAQEVEKVRPDLVVEVNGYKAVHYGGLA